MKITVKITIKPEHVHLRPIQIIRTVPSEQDAYKFGYDAGRDGFWYAVALTQQYQMVFVPPHQIVRITYLADVAIRDHIVAPPKEVDWGEVE